MKKFIRYISLTIGVIFLISCFQKETKVDLKNNRIISLSPHITEIIYALHVDTNLVAVTDFCSYPPMAQVKEKIGGLLNPNIEKIIALKPTHLFGVPSHVELNQELEKFGLQIIMMPNETITDLLQSIRLISDTLGISNRGENLISSIQDSLKGLGKKSSEYGARSGMLVIGREKGSINNITVAGANTFLHEIWKLAGCQNVFFDLGVKYGTVNLEEIIKRNPEIIVEFDMTSPPGISRMIIGKEWSVLKNVKAVKEKNIFKIGGNYSLIPGPRMFKLARDFIEILKLIHN